MQCFPSQDEGLARVCPRGAKPGSGAVLKDPAPTPAPAVRSMRLSLIAEADSGSENPKCRTGTGQQKLPKNSNSQ